MSADRTADHATDSPGTAAGRRLPLPFQLGQFAEHAILVISLSAMVVLPLLEMLRRMTLNIGISGSTAFVQHGTLIVGLVGGAVAAGQGRLLSLATASMLPATVRRPARIFGAAVGAVVAGMLAVASFQFVQTERESESILAYNIPLWTVELIMPVGFGLIAVKILWHASQRWLGRIVAMLLAGALAGVCVWQAEPSTALVVVAFVVLFTATAVGAPIFAILGGSALLLFWGAEQPIASIPIAHYSLTTNASLPTIPLFTLAGYFLAEGGASQRLVRVFSALFGSVRGGPAIVTALLCAFFTSFTGASGVTILALGGVLMPILIAARYSERAALGLLTGAGSLGMLFPPCLPLILYAIIAKLPIKSVFLGAIIPGIVLVLMTAALGIWLGPRQAQIQRARFDAREAVAALWSAKWELLIPVVALVSLLAGFATPVEASAITALYAFLTQTIISRDLTFRRGVPHVFVECGLVIGGVLLILGMAQGFTNYLIDAQIPQACVDWVTASVHSPILFLLLLNLFLLVVGGLMDIYPAIVVVVPLIVPIGEAFGIDPIHLGVIFLANLEMGFLVPPLGMNLLLSSYRFHKPIPQVYRAIIPMLVVQFIGVLLITYVPALTTWLPTWFGQK